VREDGRMAQRGAAHSLLREKKSETSATRCRRLTQGLREQQFVYHSVLESYLKEALRACDDSAASQQEAEQQLREHGQLRVCAHQSAVRDCRAAARGQGAPVIGYHFYSMQFYLVQLLVSATMDTEVSLDSTGLDMFGRIADNMVREIMTLMQVIIGFMEQLRDLIMELALVAAWARQSRTWLSSCARSSNCCTTLSGST
jgi:hypothetical protein